MKFIFRMNGMIGKKEKIFQYENMKIMLCGSCFSRTYKTHKKASKRAEKNNFIIHSLSLIPYIYKFIHYSEHIFRTHSHTQVHSQLVDMKIPFFQNYGK